MKRWRWMPAVLAAAAMLATGCGEKAPAKPLVEAESPAAQLYAKSCSGCHGEGLQGRSGPALATVGSRLDTGAIEQRITKGGSGMPAFEGRLEPDQIKDLAGWLAKQQ